MPLRLGDSPSSWARATQSVCSLTVSKMLGVPMVILRERVFCVRIEVASFPHRLCLRACPEVLVSRCFTVLRPARLTSGRTPRGVQ